MKLSEIYRRAAKLMEDGVYGGTAGCCMAIQYANPNMCDKAVNAYASVAHKHFEKYFPWRKENHWAEYRYDRMDPDRGARILALCFMAAICESEGK